MGVLTKSPVAVFGVLFLALLGSAGTALYLVKTRMAEGRFVGTATAGVARTMDIEESPDATGLPALFDAPKFGLRNQDDVAVSEADLAGKPYVAAFIFTNCTSVCPMMSGKMSGLQDKIREKDVRLVSFTVDPDRDNPEALKKYAAKFQAEAGRWFFLTGTKEQMVAVETGFNVRLPRREATDAVGDPNDPMSLMPHSDRFILVDAKGRVRGVYLSQDPDAMAKLKYDSERLARLGK